MSVRFNNTAEPAGEVAARPYYAWELFVDEPPEVLDEIAEVEYILHPTFPNPVQVRTDPHDRFALRSRGWGEFQVRARVKFKDGRVADLAYWLDLSKRREPLLAG
jgi:transcription initiation factor IIF auxiliary subunit